MIRILTTWKFGQIAKNSMTFDTDTGYPITENPFDLTSNRLGVALATKIKKNSFFQCRYIFWYNEEIHQSRALDNVFKTFEHGFIIISCCDID